MTKHIIVERAEFFEVNKKARTVKQRIIKAGVSKNKRMYSEDLLRRSVPKFEGTKTYANHRLWGARDVRDTSGWLEKPHFDEERKAIVATRHFASTDAGENSLSLISDMLDRGAPAELMGASIHALGTGEVDDETGIVHVESLDKILSVDDVDVPAAGGGFGEGDEGAQQFAASSKGIIPLILDELDYQQWREGRPDYERKLRNELKSERQDKAVKTSEAQATAAQAEADRLTGELEAAQQEIAALKESHQAELAAEQQRHATEMADLTQSHTAALETRDRAIETMEAMALGAKQELAMEKALAKSGLPSELREFVRTQVQGADSPNALIEQVGAVAAATPVNPGIKEPAGQLPQLNTTERTQRTDDWYAPRRDESYAEWRERTR